MTIESRRYDGDGTLVEITITPLPTSSRAEERSLIILAALLIAGGLALAAAVVS